MPVLTQKEAIDFFSLFYGGQYNIPGNEVLKWGYGWMVKHDRGDLSTFDNNSLTRLVVMAHDMCLRVEITSIKANIIRIAISKRERIADLFKGHPTIENHIEHIRKMITLKQSTSP